MHSSADVDAVLRLRASGDSASAIAKATGLPRSTVRDWLAGRTPRRLATETDCVRCDEPHPAMEAVAGTYVYLLGLYLGDGCVSLHPRGVHRLRITLDVRYPGIIDECCEAISAVAPGNRVGRSMRSAGGFTGSLHASAVEVSAYARWWPCVLPQHGPGRKHERPIVLAEWQLELVEQHPGQLLRGLIHSDGCRFVNTGTNWVNPRYSFSNRSADIRGIFTTACDRLGVRWTTAPYTVYVSRKADVAVLDGLIGPKR